MAQRWRFLVAFAMALAWGGSTTRAGEVDIVVVANRALSLSTATRDQLRPLFQTKASTWSDGSAAKPFNLPENNPTRHGFDAAVLGLDPDRVARYWIDRKIRGGERPPTTAPSPALMLRLVAATPGGVGYVPASAVNDTVKVIARIRDGEVVRP